MSDTQSIDDLDKEISDLQAKRKAIFDSTRSAVLEATLSTVIKYKFTAVELGLVGLKATQKEVSTKVSASEKAEPKYQDPATGKTWGGGRGATPKWVKAHIDAGRSMDEFLIKK